MKRLELARLLAAAKRLIRHRDFVIVGSLSILGATLDPPEEMVTAWCLEPHESRNRHNIAKGVAFSITRCINLAACRPSID